MTGKDITSTGLCISYLIPVITTTNLVLFPLLKVSQTKTSLASISKFISDSDTHNSSQNQRNTKNSNNYTKKMDNFTLGWPSKGKIVAKNLCCRKEDSKYLTLNHLNFQVEPGQKVILIGGEHSGKSLVLRAILRMLKLARNDDGRPIGSLKIDGLDIESLPRTAVRGSLAVVPKTPFLLEGELRFNIDPKGLHTDSEIIDVLEKVGVLETITVDLFIKRRKEEIRKQLKKKFKKLRKSEQKRRLKKHQKTEEGYIEALMDEKGDKKIAKMRKMGISKLEKLGFQVAPGGSNLTLAQRQLISLAQALIKHTRVLIIEDMGQSTGKRMDKVMEQLLREGLRGTSVLACSDRLSIVPLYEKVIFLKFGRKVEEGQPRFLLGKENGHLIDLAKGVGGDEFLRKLRMAAKDPSIRLEVLFQEMK